MEEHEPVIESLRALGKEPVDPVTANRHLSQMVDVRARTPFSTKVKVGAAFGIGILVGSTGLATAGALPGPAQGVAHTVLSSVGVHVPGGPQRYNGPECGGTYKNHGQYVRAHTQDPNAGQSRCGKPIQAGTGSDSTNAPDTPDNPSGTAPGNPSGTAPGNPSGKANGNGHGNTKSHGHAGQGNNEQSGNSDDSGLTTPASQAPVAPSPTTTTTSSTSTSTTSTTTTTLG
jgi:hypothetical protein